MQCIDECVNVFIWTPCDLILVIYIQYYNNVMLTNLCVVLLLYLTNISPIYNRNYYYFFFQYSLKMNTCRYVYCENM